MGAMNTLLFVLWTFKSSITVPPGFGHSHEIHRGHCMIKMQNELEHGITIPKGTSFKTTHYFSEGRLNKYVSFEAADNEELVRGLAIYAIECKVPFGKTVNSVLKDLPLMQ